MNVFGRVLADMIDALFYSGAEFTRKLVISQDTLDNWKKGKYMPSDNINSKRCTINDISKHINDRYCKLLNNGTIKSDVILDIMIKSGLPQQAKDRLYQYVGSNDFPGRVIYAAYEYEKIRNEDDFTVTMEFDAGMYPYLERKSMHGSETNENDYIEKIIIDKRNFIIGRKNKAADYVCCNNFVSKSHAEIISRDGRYFVKDLGSTNGTFVNGKRIEKLLDIEIKNNDKIKFADWEYTFKIPEG
ncbi:MAG TPA: FHA domain-containing protein [Pseudobacteroides sp.]|nr:FHA domain-containing protein [Pseudobacteroides sp.]